MMATIFARRPPAVLLFLMALLALALGGCAAPKASSSSTELPFDQATAQAADGLAAQARPVFLARLEAKRGVVVDPMIDALSGQQTAATQLLQARVGERLGAQSDAALELLPFQSANLTKASYLLTGTLTRLRMGVPRSPLRIDLALTDLRNGMVVAQSSSVARDDGLDHTPLPYYQDSPVPMKDEVVAGYVRTTATAPGQSADPAYWQRIAVAPLISEATTLYNAQRYQDALSRYSAAGESATGGGQLRVLSGIYLSAVRLGRSAEAEQAFGKIVAYGVANQELGVKFLFNPNTTLFWSDPQVSGPYPMWLREIARAGTDSKACFDIVGHTSHTGTVEYNDALSLKRANYVRQRLLDESAALGGRTKTIGRGFRENLVGTGTDDAVDALDRRVEFKIVGCE